MEEEKTQRKRPCEDGGKDGGVWPQATGHLEPLETRRVRKVAAPEPSEGAQPGDTLILTFGLENRQRRNGSGCKVASLGWVVMAAVGSNANSGRLAVTHRYKVLRE